MFTKVSQIQGNILQNKHFKMFNKMFNIFQKRVLE